MRRRLVSSRKVLAFLRLLELGLEVLAVREALGVDSTRACDIVLEAHRPSA